MNIFYIIVIYDYIVLSTESFPRSRFSSVDWVIDSSTMELCEWDQSAVIHLKFKKKNKKKGRNKRTFQEG